MGGNMRSRWTDFLTTDGEKPNRHRDQEFEIAPGTTRADVMQLWEEGWECVFGAVTPLKSEDLTRKVLIAGREHSVLQAINRQLLHYAGHVNQIVMLAKHFRGAEWKSLSIPKGKSESFAREFEKTHAARAEARKLLRIHVETRTVFLAKWKSTSPPSFANGAKEGWGSLITMRGLTSSEWATVILSGTAARLRPRCECRVRAFDRRLG